MGLFIALLLLVNLLIGCWYLILACILATEFEDRDIEPHYYGYILGAYALSSILCSFWVSWFIKKLGRSAVLFSGILLMSISVIITGLITYIENDDIMIMVAILWRLSQGFFKNLVLVPSFSIIVITNPVKRVMYLGIMECVLSLGTAIGPVVGSILYSIFGYFYMFCFIGLLFLVITPAMMLSKPLNIDDEEETDTLVHNVDPADEFEKKLTYYDILSDHTIQLISLALLVATVAFSYFEPVLSFRLFEFTDSVQVHSLIFSWMIGGYSAMALMVTLLIKQIKPINLVASGMLLWGFWNFLVGPSVFLPDSIVLIALGLFLSGMTIVCCTVPQLPIMLECLESKYPTQAHIASDYCSSIYNAVFSLGMFLGPVYGGHVTELLGFRVWCDIMGVILIIYSIVFYILNLVWSRSESKITRKTNDLSTSVCFSTDRRNIINL